MADPAKRTVLLNPGPVTLTDSVRQSLLGRDMCHREEAFSQLMQRVRGGLLDVYSLDSSKWSSVLLTGSGTAAVESMVTSIVDGAGTSLVAANGVYGERIATMLERCGKPSCLVRSEWGEPIDFSSVERELQTNQAIQHVIAVHHETTTGRLNDLDRLADLCRQYEKRLLVDAVSSFGGEAIDFQGWPVDAVAGTANKCLHGVPGIAFVISTRKAIKKASNHEASGLYLDLATNWKSQEGGFPAFTPAIFTLSALEQARVELKQQGGWQHRRKVYQQRMDRVTSFLRSLGVEALLATQDQSCLLTAYRLPAGMRYQDISDPLMKQNIVIYAGQKHLEDQIFRIAVMGDLRDEDFRKLESVLTEVLSSHRPAN